MTRTLNLEARDKILEAALKLIHARGFRDVSMDDMAEAAGLKKANLFHYYPTKEQLGLAALERAIREQREKVAERFSRGAGDPIQTVAAMFTEPAEGMRRSGCSKGCLLGNLAQELSDLDEQFRSRLNEYFEFWAGEIADMLERARRSGYFRKDLKPLEAAHAILSLFEGAMTLCKAKKDPQALVSSGRMAASYLKAFKT
jgi:TetR/AcrR family transcriptional repressor of nem operon